MNSQMAVRLIERLDNSAYMHRVDNNFVRIEFNFADRTLHRSQAHGFDAGNRMMVEIDIELCVVVFDQIRTFGRGGRA